MQSETQTLFQHFSPLPLEVKMPLHHFMPDVSLQMRLQTSVVSVVAQGACSLRQQIGFRERNRSTPTSSCAHTFQMKGWMMAMFTQPSPISNERALCLSKAFPILLSDWFNPHQHRWYFLPQSHFDYECDWCSSSACESVTFPHWHYNDPPTAWCSYDFMTVISSLIPNRRRRRPTQRWADVPSVCMCFSLPAHQYVTKISSIIVFWDFLHVVPVTAGYFSVCMFLCLCVLLLCHVYVNQTQAVTFH